MEHLFERGTRLRRLAEEMPGGAASLGDAEAQARLVLPKRGVGLLKSGKRRLGLTRREMGVGSLHPGFRPGRAEGCRLPERRGGLAPASGPCGDQAEPEGRLPRRGSLALACHKVGAAEDGLRLLIRRQRGKRIAEFQEKTRLVREKAGRLSQGGGGERRVPFGKQGEAEPPPAFGVVRAQGERFQPLRLGLRPRPLLPERACAERKADGGALARRLIGRGRIRRAWPRPAPRNLRPTRKPAFIHARYPSPCPLSFTIVSPCRLPACPHIAREC